MAKPKKNIAQSFSVGRKAENFVVSLMVAAGYEGVELNSTHEDRYDYDIKCKDFTAEVKYDMMAQKTGNIAIEFWNSKKNEGSGITTTKSDLWFHVLQDGSNMVAWVCSVASLQQFLKDHTPLRVIHAGGDNNASLYLYAENDILDVLFKRCDMLSSEALKKLIKGLLK